jgi:hypothetical protein
MPSHGTDISSQETAKENKLEKADVIPNQWWSETSSKKSVLLSGLRERDFHITTRQILQKKIRA